MISAKRKTIEILSDRSLHLHTDGIRHAHVTWSLCFMAHTQEGGGTRLSETSYTYDPPIYDITSGCKDATLFLREAQRWTPDAIWFPRYISPTGKGNYVS